MSRRSPRDWAEVLLPALARRDGLACYYSPPGEPHYLPRLEDYEIEHRTPRARGGTDDPDNLVLACPSCNAEKGTLTEAEFVG